MRLVCLAHGVQPLADGTHHVAELPHRSLAVERLRCDDHGRLALDRCQVDGSFRARRRTETRIVVHHPDRCVDQRPHASSHVAIIPANSLALGEGVNTSLTTRIARTVAERRARRRARRLDSLPRAHERPFVTQLLDHRDVAKTQSTPTCSTGGLSAVASTLDGLTAAGLRRTT
jgi:hypothetical protein